MVDKKPHHSIEDLWVIPSEETDEISEVMCVHLWTQLIKIDPNALHCFLSSCPKPRKTRADYPGRSDEVTKELTISDRVMFISNSLKISDVGLILKALKNFNDDEQIVILCRICGICGINQRTWTVISSKNLRLCVQFFICLEPSLLTTFCVEYKNTVQQILELIPTLSPEDLLRLALEDRKMILQELSLLPK
jgi:hypothetical protein